MGEPNLAATIPQPELAVTMANLASLSSLGKDRAGRQAQWAAALGDLKLADWLSSIVPTHIYLGSEFCEHLLPTPNALRNGIKKVLERNCRASLLTPIAAPKDLRALGELLPILPDGSEVIASDWGTAYFIRTHFPGLRLVAGRILCRMIKDPRLDAAKSDVAGRFDPRPLRSMLSRLGFARMEIDVPLSDAYATISNLPMPASVHVPFACVAKGRMCRIGSTAITGSERFGVGRRCKKECLSASTRLERPGKIHEREVYEVGNSIISRHSNEMFNIVMDAAKEGLITRLVVPGGAL